MIDQEFVKYIVSALVGKPEAVKVDRVVDERGVLLTLHVDSEDLGRVIGRKGSTAQSLRTLLRALGTKNEAHYNLRIADENGQSSSNRHDSFKSNSRRHDDSRQNQPQSTPSSTSREGVWGDEPTPATEKTADSIDSQPTEDKKSDDSLLDKTKKELGDLNIDI